MKEKKHIIRAKEVLDGEKLNEELKEMGIENPNLGGGSPEPSVVVDSGFKAEIAQKNEGENKTSQFVEENLLEKEGEKTNNPGKRVVLGREDTEKLNEELEKMGIENPRVGGGSSEVHAQGFQAPTEAQISEAQADKHRAEMAQVPLKKPWWKIW